jgi:hypothetical protein
MDVTESRSQIATGRPRRIGRGPTCAVLAVVLATAFAVPDESREDLSRPIETDQVKAARDAASRGGEVLHLRWKLSGFLGMLAGLFVPNNGDALLTFVPTSEDRIEIGVLVTAPKRAGDYFVYGAEIDEGSGATSTVWSSYAYGDSNRDREQQLDTSDVIDYASAIYRLRWNPPETTTRMTIWDMGKTYPVEVEPLKPRNRNIGGKKILARGYEIRGVKIKGEPSFGDKFYLYFADDAESTPVEIVGKRSMVRVRFQLIGTDGPPRQARRATPAH